MALSDLWTSRDPKDVSGASLYGSGAGNSIYNSARYGGSFSGLDSLQPVQNAGQTPNRNLAPNYTLGGVNTALSSAYTNPTGTGNWRPQTQAQVAPGPVDEALRQTVQSANSGGISRGASAFLGSGFQPWAMELGNDGEYRPAADAAAQWGELRNLASAVGVDPTGYGDGGKDMRTLYDLVNDATKDFYGIGGLSTGWSGTKHPRGASRTLYRDMGGGNLRPVSTPQHYMANETSGDMLRGAVQDLSMVLPAFGGWAGILGAGTAGTLSAGSGLGLTTGLGSAIGTGAANALVNAGMGAMTSGSGGQGFLNGLLSQGLGAGVGSLTGGANNLGSMFNTANAGVSALNPMGYFRDQMGRMGLGGSPVGMATRVPGWASSLSRLFSS